MQWQWWGKPIIGFFLSSIIPLLSGNSVLYCYESIARRRTEDSVDVAVCNSMYLRCSSSLWAPLQYIWMEFGYPDLYDVVQSFQAGQSYYIFEL